jgi:hypothetical protein
MAGTSGPFACLLNTDLIIARTTNRVRNDNGIIWTQSNDD